MHIKNIVAKKRIFVKNKGLQKLQELKLKVSKPLKIKWNDINSYSPDDIVICKSPDYAAYLLQKIGANTEEGVLL